MSDVYVLASPSPTLFVYPSALHPVPPPTTGGAPFRPYYPLPLRLDEDPNARRRRDELALQLLAHP